MKLKASVKRTIRLGMISLRNGFYRLFGSKNYGKFIIITRSRTGSNLLISLLNSHPEIEAYGEMFNQLHGLTSEWIWNSIFGFKSSSVKFVRFKIFYYHPLNSDDRWIWNKIYSDNTIPVIHLVRDNTLQTFLSKQIADKTKVWQNQNGKNFFDDESKRVYLNPKKYLEVFERTERWVNDTDQKPANHRTIKISYEEITGDKQSDTLEKCKLSWVFHQWLYHLECKSRTTKL